MTNNNWEDELDYCMYGSDIDFMVSFNDGSVKYPKPYQLRMKIKNLLTKKDQEHKAELEMIKEEIEGKLDFDYSDNKLKNHRELGVKQAYRDSISILDSHINKLN